MSKQSQARGDRAAHQVHEDRAGHVATCGRSGASSKRGLPWPCMKRAATDAHQFAPPEASLKYTLTRSSCRSDSPAYCPDASTPCSSQITCTAEIWVCKRGGGAKSGPAQGPVCLARQPSSCGTLHVVSARTARGKGGGGGGTSQNFAPIWLPHCPKIGAKRRRQHSSWSSGDSRSHRAPGAGGGGGVIRRESKHLLG